MFNTIIHSKTEYVPYEKSVKEHRAPTDESIRLYHELVTAAEKSVLGKITVPGNDFKCELVIRRNEYDMRIWVLALLSMNGKEHKVEIHFDHDIKYLAAEARVDHILKSVKDAVCEWVTELVLVDMAYREELCNYLRSK